MNWRFGASIMDTQNGFGAIKSGVARKLELSSGHTETETEMCVKCFRKGCRILEVPSGELKRKHGSSKLSIWRHG